MTLHAVINIIATKKKKIALKNVSADMKSWQLKTSFFYYGFITFESSRNGLFF